MQQRHRFTRRQVLTAGSTLLIPAAVLAWWQPWRTPATPASTPTPPPPTATFAPERIALPSERPLRPIVPPVTPIPATPIPATPTGPQASGSILFTGRLGGRIGALGGAASGDGFHLVAPGNFDSLAWSPDGSYFAAAGPLEDGTYQVAIFDPEGRPLARYPFDHFVSWPLRWSPDGRSLLVTARPPAGTPGLEAWVVSDDGVSAVVPPGTEAELFVGQWDWRPDGQLTCLTYLLPVSAARSRFWTRAAGQEWQLISEGVSPLGWDRSSIRLAFMESTPPPSSEGGGGLTVLGTLDTVGKSRAVLATAGDLAATALGEDGAGYVFTTAALARDGESIAVVVARWPGGAGSGVAPITPRMFVVCLDARGQVRGSAELGNLDSAWGLSWSPDGRLLAQIGYSSEVRLFDATATPLATYALSPRPGKSTAAEWSPDSRWLLLADATGLAVAATTGSPYRYQIAPEAGFAYWRPHS